MQGHLIHQSCKVIQERSARPPKVTLELNVGTLSWQGCICLFRFNGLAAGKKPRAGMCIHHIKEYSDGGFAMHSWLLSSTHPVHAALLAYMTTCDLLTKSFILRPYPLPQASSGRPSSSSFRDTVPAEPCTLCSHPVVRVLMGMFRDGSL